MPAYRTISVIATLLCAAFGARGQEVINPISLEASVITASPPPVQVIADTLVFSTSAYSLDDDATLEDFLKKIPGLEYNGGSISLYGRKVEKLLVNGKLYFGDNLAAGLKSLSAEDGNMLHQYLPL